MADLLSPQTWPFSLNWLPEPAYLVGGGVRDALRGKPSAYLDLDFVLPSQPVETARAIARHYKAGFVLLDAERQIARVVFEVATADFALQVGPTLITDLQHRDFTVNAIAYEPHTGEIIDPLQGHIDLQAETLRMVAAENLAEDPLRLLRAYRQAAQLDFHLDPLTQRQIRQLAPRLQKVAAERVRAELSYLLSTAAGTPLLQAAWADGLFSYWFPALTATALTKLAAMDRAAVELAAQWPQLYDQLHRCLNDKARGGEASRRTLLANAKLLYFQPPQPEQVIAGLHLLKYSRAEINLVLTLLKCLPQVQSDAAVQHLTRRELYFLFQTVGTAFPALVVLAMAEGTSLQAITPLLKSWLDPTDPVAHPPVLISGRDLVEKLYLPPGPVIGQLLGQLEIAQAEGKITTPAEALDLAEVLREALH